LLGDLPDLQPGRRPAVPGRAEQGLRELAVGLRYRGHAPGDVGGGILSPVGIMSKSWRTSCTQPVATLSSLVVSPAS
jgi:hypothetical protein